MKFLAQWKDDNLKNHDIQLGNSKNEIKSGDILFLISALIVFKISIRVIMNIKFLSFRKFFIRFRRVP